MKKHYKLLGVPLILTSALLAGCPSDDNDSTTVSNTRQFEITVTSLTNHQPLSPFAIVLHKSGYHAFTDGQAASVALENLAEGGSNAQLLTEANANSAHIANASGSGALAAGSNESTQISTPNQSDIQLTFVSMLVNTNDGFTAVNAQGIGQLSLNESLTFNAPVWDAGTEANTETQATVPGLGGEGFNTARDDIMDKVAFHRGVVTKDDGLSTSDLDQSHRFDNPAARVVVKRIK